MVLTLIGLLAGFAEPPAAAQPSAPKPKLICRGDEVATGSHQHTGTRCRTKEDWDAEDAGRHDGLPATSRLTTRQDGQTTATRPH